MIIVYRLEKYLRSDMIIVAIHGPQFTKWIILLILPVYRTARLPSIIY